MKYPNLIIFDLDGVIIDSKKIHFDSLNQALNSINKKYKISKDEHLTTYDGLPTKEKLVILNKKKKLPEKFNLKIWKLKQEISTNHFKKIKPNLKLKKNIMILKKNNFKVAIASNAIKETVYLILKKLKIYDLFDSIMTTDDVTLPKPHPEIYWNIMTKIKTTPTNTTIIEDSPVGRMGAKNSGCKLVEVIDSCDLDDNFFKKLLRKEKNYNKNFLSEWTDKDLNILVPMAGSGSRFKQAGYTFPKPLIEVNGKPMIQNVIENLNINATWIFIVQKEHYDKYNIKNMLNLIKPNCKVVITDSLTEGAACTTLLAKKFIDSSKPLLIANSDQIIDWDASQVMYQLKSSKVDGGILTFRSSHPKWSYARIDKKNFVDLVAEKNPISNNATCGIYFWKKGSDYVKYAEKMIKKNVRVNGEFYVCPVYNQAIEDDKKIVITPVNKMYGIGTPEDLNNYLNIKKL